MSFVKNYNPNDWLSKNRKAKIINLGNADTLFSVAKQYQRMSLIKTRL